jgi:hypothetical protein
MSAIGGGGSGEEEVNNQGQAQEQEREPLLVQMATQVSRLDWSVRFGLNVCWFTVGSFSG